MIILKGKNYSYFRLSFICAVLVTNLTFSQSVLSKNDSSISWQDIKSKGMDLFNTTLDSFNSGVDYIDNELKMLDVRNSGNNLKEKIDTLKSNVNDIVAKKKQKEEASSFTLFSMSKHDYQIEIDEVLKELEDVLFDGEIVNYADKIRRTRQVIKASNDKIAVLHEKIVFASSEKSLIKSSKQELEEEVRSLEKIISKSEGLIKALEYDLKVKLNSLSIPMSTEQVRVLTTRVDGDNLSKTFAIYDVTRQITQSLELLIQKNSFNTDSTLKYYGTYMILSEILGYSQRTYINEIENTYLPALETVRSDIQGAISFAEDTMSNSQSSANKKVLLANIQSNEFALNVLNTYEEILENQKDQIQQALEQTNEQIAVAYSTYDTAANTTNLLALINRTQSEFDKIMSLQLPKIIPFSNNVLEEKFEDLSKRIILASK